MRKSLLSRIRILLADSDACMTRVVTQNLRAMGFDNISLARTEAETVEHLKKNPIDILITEMIPPVNGVDIIMRLRRGEKQLNRILPVIMLTGKGEMADVRLARDRGVTEFVIKPFSAKALYSRLEQIIDHPRGFVMSSVYIGPDRRRRKIDNLSAERRQAGLRPVNPADSFALRSDEPKIILPTTQIKQYIGLSKPLSSIVTPAVLANAQRVIDSMETEVIQWVQEDLAALQKGMSYGDEASIKAAALSIKSRAGTVGYELASEVARRLHLFVNEDFDANDSHQQIAVMKYTESLNIIFRTEVKKREGMGNKLLSSLDTLGQIQRSRSAQRS